MQRILTQLVTFATSVITKGAMEAYRNAKAGVVSPFQRVYQFSR
jgi:hypothetical protein